MKIRKSLAAVLLAAFSCALLSFAPGAYTTDVVNVKKGKITINNVVVTENWSVDLYRAALGNPDRIYRGYNIVHTYDDKGINIFEKAVDSVGTGTVSEIQFYFRVEERGDLTPKEECFPGTLKIDKLTVTRNLTATEMLNKLKKWKKTDSYTEHNYRMASNGLYVYFLFNDSEDKLLKVSIGPDKRQ